MVNTNRPELIGFVDQYLEALAAGRPDRLSLARDARFTENAKILTLGDGLWRKTVERIPGGQYFVDDTMPDVAYFGSIKADGKNAILSVRLKIDSGEICEIETVLVPEGGFLFNAEGAATKREAWNEEIPPAERRGREEMFRITDLYFEGIEQNNGDLIPLDPEAFRIENGQQTANRKSKPETDMGPMNELVMCGVAEQLNKGFFQYIAAIRDRRYLIADETRGVTFGIFLFDHPGRVQEGSESRLGRSCGLIAEAFKIRNGLITQVEAVGTMIPYGAQSGWSWSFAKP